MDRLNNSQLILLVLLISLVVSAATAVATFSVLYERFAASSENAGTPQPRVIQQTINRIIERERVLPTESDSVAVDEYAGQKADGALTLEDIEDSMVQLYFGSQPFVSGVYVSSDGYILVPEVLDKQRRYSTLDSAGEILFYSLVYTDGTYSLLAPMNVYPVSRYIPLIPVSDVSLGQTVLLFGGSGEDAQLHSGIISQKRSGSGGVISFRTSVGSSEITELSVVFIDNVFVGFAPPHFDWLTVVASDLAVQIGLVREELTVES